MKRFVLTPDAAQDLDDIWEYIAADSLDAADRLTGELYDRILVLAATPGIGLRREDLAEERPLLFWPVGNYPILYRVINRFVEVVAVAHGKRNIPSFIRLRGV